MPDVAMQPATKPFFAEMAPPGSKSLSNRAMVLAAMAEGSSTLTNVLFADDTLVMIDGCFFDDNCSPQTTPGAASVNAL